MQFIDYVKIHVLSGAGGPGGVSFRREKYVPRGGPDGGDGGRGGHVIIKADPQLNTLLDLRYQQLYKAAKGQQGMGRKRHGSDGQDIIIRVPVGSVIKDIESDELLADLDKPQMQFVAAEGGKGGLGNQNFATAVRQAPRYAQKGLPGEEFKLTVELKLLADVGLIGLPNAGKSTLISVITSARPKIADYPFTTLVPNLGIVKTGDFRSFVVADIPGLIEGAHDGAGLGHQFLRHVERAGLLLHLVDVGETGEDDPVRSLQTLNRELELYNPELLQKPQAVAGTKTDTKGSGEKLDSLGQYCKTNEIDFFPISSITHDGVEELTRYLALKVAR